MKGKTLLKNMSWKFAERITAQLVTFVVSIILARLLEPSDYGVVSLVMVFITIANVFVSDGLGSALIQKKDADSLDFSSALYFNIGFSIVLYVLIFFLAPVITNFFGKNYEILTNILRVLGLRIIVAAINSIQQAYVSRKMLFEKFFWATLFGTLASAFVGVWMAYHGYGAWALVGQYLTNTIVDTLVLAIVLHKKPIFAFSYKRIKKLFNYGIKVLGSGLLIAIYTKIRSFIIGKIYKTSDLAFYNRADQFPSLFVGNVVTSISAVLFPEMASIQENIEKVKAVMKRSIRFTAYMMCPLLFGLAAIADNLVIVLLTDKWLPCVPYLRILCVSYLWYPIHSTNLQSIKAIGRSDIALKTEVIKKAIETITLLCVMFINVKAIVISMAVNSTIFMFVNAYPNQKYIGYSIIEQLNDIVEPLLMSMFMFVIVYALNYLQINSVLLMGIQIIVGAGIYVCISMLKKNREFYEILSLIKHSRNIRSN